MCSVLGNVHSVVFTFSVTYTGIVTTVGMVYVRHFYMRELVACIGYGNSVRLSVHPSVHHDPVPFQDQLR